MPVINPLFSQYPFLSQLERVTDDPSTCRRRYFKRLSFENGYEISIQAFDGAYCIPREDSLKAEEYTHFEIAIFDQNQNYVTADMLGDLSEAVEQNEPQVWPYMPRVKVQIIVDFVSRMQKPVENEDCDACEQSLMSDGLQADCDGI
jgi:hypothetical protein